MTYYFQHVRKKYSSNTLHYETQSRKRETCVDWGEREQTSRPNSKDRGPKILELSVSYVHVKCFPSLVLQIHLNFVAYNLHQSPQTMSFCVIPIMSIHCKWLIRGVVRWRQRRRSNCCWQTILLLSQVKYDLGILFALFFLKFNWPALFGDFYRFQYPVMFCISCSCFTISLLTFIFL